MARDLINIKFKRVALVDKGANFDKETKDGAHIVLWKRHVEKGGPTLGSVHVDGITCKCADCLAKVKKMNFPEWLKKMVGASSPEEIAELEKNFPGMPGAPNPGMPGTPAPGAPAPGAPAPAAPAPGGDALATLKALYVTLGHVISSFSAPAAGAAPHPAMQQMKSMKSEIAKAIGIKEDEETNVDETIVKTEIEKATVSLQKQLDDAKAANTETVNLLKAERATRLQNEMVTVLKSFKATPFNVDLADEKNDVKKFLKMQEADPEGYARTMEIFKSADAQLAESALFARQLGSNRGGSQGSAEAQLVAKAEVIQKSVTGMTKEAAFEQASLENPALVKQYRAEQQ